MFSFNHVVLAVAVSSIMSQALPSTVGGIAAGMPVAIPPSCVASIRTAEGRVCLCFRLTLPPYYAESGHDYVCGMPESDGMSRCSSLPPFGYHRGGSDRTFIACNLSLDDYRTTAPWMASRWTDIDNETSWLPCVDWNRYYSRCSAEADNPFHGAVSFDDIGHAWVAIFQVTMSCHATLSVFYTAGWLAPISAL
jgi:hypothetical protein